MSQLRLENYSSFINLMKEYKPSTLFLNRKEEIVDRLLLDLDQESGDMDYKKIPRDYITKRNILRGSLNQRDTKPLDEHFLKRLDSLLQTELEENGITEINSLKSVSEEFPENNLDQSNKLVLWHGDITLLNADAIVNAANKQMLGCFLPLHKCIDNAIHSAAGPQLREDCNTIMSLQGEPEQTGLAKITRAYNLPSRFVLHTVGPIVPKGTTLTELQKKQLKNSYISCLELANKIDVIKSIAFCAISTGVFGFPKDEAAYIAISTVNEWLSNHNNHFEKIVFNVFTEADKNEYINAIKTLH
ncbi:protein-ADP-ribose hydrolase [Terribacillus saccharophilus]|uniref:protein-ADP-ribose hydrolase n=1 Tax=Terribacillus saccharophilus TaxID=361277 RepID=UPI0039829FC6